MDYWFKSYDENAYFYAISGTVTPKCIAGVVVSETQGAPRLIADGDVRNEMAATWTAYRRQSNYPDSPWGSGTVNQFWYNSTYDVTWAQIPQTLNRQPYSSNVHLITDISIELVLSKAREYFDHYVPGQGVGEVTLQTDPPSQLLTFTSRELGKSFKYWIRGNQTVELYTQEEHEAAIWEILWMFNFQGTKGIMLVDSNFNCTVYNDLQDITGEIIQYTASTSKVSAVQKCAASYGNTGAQLTSGTFNANADISTFNSELEMMVLAKKNLSGKIPYELGFYWVKPNTSSSQFCIVKANEASVVTFTGSLLTGDRMTLEYRGIYDKVLASTYQGATFNGKIKEADLSVTGNWQEIDASSVDSLYGVFGVAIAIPS